METGLLGWVGGSALWWLLIAIPTVRHLGPRRRITQPMLSQPVNPELDPKNETGG